MDEILFFIELIGIFVLVVSLTATYACINVCSKNERKHKEQEMRVEEEYFKRLNQMADYEQTPNDIDMKAIGYIEVPTMDLEIR